MKTKIILMILVACLFWTTGKAQVAINTDGSLPSSNAMLDVKSTSKGFLPPRMANTEMTSIASPVAGLVVFCTDCNCGIGSLNVYEGGGWHGIGVAPVLATSCGTTFVYYPVCAAGYTWLDRNLAASRQAASSTDYQAYGSLFQWGRKSDGHQCINWTSSNSGTPQNGTTYTQCTNGTCPNALFFVWDFDVYDWNTPTSNILWNGGTKGANDPCPSGYRVPSQAEFTALELTFSPHTSVGAFNSPLKMPMAGERYASFGNLTSTGTVGAYWSSTYSTANYAYYLDFYSSSSGVYVSSRRHEGYSVRCIAQ